MRKTADRIRQAVAFEAIALLVVGPLGGWVFGHGIMSFGLVALISSVVATGWAFLYNLGFDHALVRWRGTAEKGMALRVVHAVLLEAGLIVLLVPVVAWTLGIGLVEAFWIDIALAGFFLVYAFVFYWVYDRLFPLPAAAPGPAT